LVWLLLCVGITLTVVGAWGGPSAHPTADRPEPTTPPDLSAPQAWEILSRPVANEELIRLPEHRPWYMPGRDRRFLQGVLVGVGSGFLLAALVVTVLPKPASLRPPQVVDGGSQQPGETAGGPGVRAAPAPIPQPLTRTFVVEDGDAAPRIAAKLRGAGLIADEDAFVRRVANRGLDTHLKAGTFIISTGASLDEVIDSLAA